MLVREAIGLIASTLVMLSYMFTGKNLRIINLVGSVLFLIYGYMIDGLSIMILNGCSIIVHLYYILKEEN